MSERPMFHLEPIWKRDRSVVPEEAMTEEDARRVRAELLLAGVETRRPLPVGANSIRDQHGQRRPLATTTPKRAQRWDGDHE